MERFYDVLFVALLVAGLAARTLLNIVLTDTTLNITIFLGIVLIFRNFLPTWLIMDMGGPEWLTRTRVVVVLLDKIIRKHNAGAGRFLNTNLRLILRVSLFIFYLIHLMMWLTGFRVISSILLCWFAIDLSCDFRIDVQEF